MLLQKVILMPIKKKSTPEKNSFYSILKLFPTEGARAAGRQDQLQACGNCQRPAQALGRLEHSERQWPPELFHETGAR